MLHFLALSSLLIGHWPSFGQGLPEHLRGHPQVHQEVLHLGGEEPEECVGFFEVGKVGVRASDLAQRKSFLPSCLPDKLQNQKDFLPTPALGLAMGSVMDVSVVIGAGAGVELVVMREGNGVLLGLVEYAQGTLGIGGLGLAETFSWVFGECENSLLGYLGYFSSATGLLYTHNRGVKDFFAFQDEHTGCDSLSIPYGTTADVGAFHRSKYWLMGKATYAEGERVDRFLAALSESSEKKAELDVMERALPLALIAE